MITTKVPFAGANDRAAFPTFIAALVREGFEDYQVLDCSQVNLQQLKVACHMEEEALLESGEQQAAALRRDDSIADEDPIPNAP